MRALSDGQVDYIIIGGMAALLHGDIVGTADLDAAVSETPDNLDRLVTILKHLEARILVDAGRGALATVDQPVDRAWFQQMASIRLLTRHGILDIVLAADGIGRYPGWDRQAITVGMDGYIVRVAALADVITSKRAANRDKDRAAIPRLEALEAQRNR